MFDLSFGLPIVVRDAALKMVAPGPQSAINREYYAQEHEKEIEEGRGAVEAYEKTDEKARELLKRLAHSEPYYKKHRRLEESKEEEPKQIEGPSEPKRSAYGNAPGPVRTTESRRGGTLPGRGARAAGRGGKAFPSTAQIPPSPADYNPPADPKIMSLFVTGVEDDLPEYELRDFFSQFGQLRSVVCSHRAHCAFINYTNRASAEAAAMHCKGRAVIKGCPLRVRWGKPRQLDTMSLEERQQNAREGREVAAVTSGESDRKAITVAGDAAAPEPPKPSYAVAPPPGSAPVQYASLSGD